MESLKLKKSDLCVNGEGQVSSYLMERKVVKHIKKISYDENEFIKYEDKLLRATTEDLFVYHSRLANNQEISLKELFKTTPKKQ